MNPTMCLINIHVSNYNNITHFSVIIKKVVSTQQHFMYFIKYILTSCHITDVIKLDKLASFHAWI